MRKILSTSLIALALSACGGGGGGDSAPKNSAEPERGFDLAYFVDSLVIGLEYKLLPSGDIRTIESSGAIVLNRDTTEVAIIIGQLELPPVDVREIITPEDIFPDNPNASSNVLRLVQSLDTDDDPTTITINQSAVEKVSEDIDITVQTDNFIEELEAEAPALFDNDDGGLNKEDFVTSEQAQEHFEDTKTRLSSVDFDGDGFNNDIDLCPFVPSESNELLDSDADKTADICDADDDNDGLTDNEEQKLSTNPLKADTDDDGFTDGAEINEYSTDPLKADSDDDGLSDTDEINTYETDPNLLDSDSDGLSDGDEINIYKTQPLSKDSDSDGLNDDVEIKDFNTDPNNADTDGDGIDDGAEIEAETNPNDGTVQGVWDNANWDQSVWQ